MIVAELAEELAKGSIRPGYLLVGSEPLLRDEGLAAIEVGVLGEGPRDFNLDRFELGKVTPGQLEEALASLPVMAPMRLVVLRETEGRSAKLDASWGERLAAWISEAGTKASAVLVVVSAKVDKRGRWVKAFRDHGALVECDAPTRARDLLRFVEVEAERQGVSLERDAARLLAERVGPQLLLLRQEIEKASLLAGPGAPVERRHVEASVALVAEEPIWDLTDAIGEGRAAEALDILARIFVQGAPAPVVLAALATHFRKLARVGHGESIGGSPFILRKLEQQARRLPSRRLLACLRAVHRADVELKGAGVQDPERALEQLVLDLAS